VPIDNASGRLQENLDRLTVPYRATVLRLIVAFSDCDNDLWRDGRPNAAGSRVEFLDGLAGKDLNDLGDGQLDDLLCKAVTTIGSVSTLKFLLPRFFAAYFADPHKGWVAEPWLVAQKLKAAAVEDWPAALAGTAAGRSLRPAVDAVVREKAGSLEGGLCARRAAIDRFVADAFAYGEAAVQGAFPKRPDLSQAADEILRDTVLGKL